MPPSKPIRTCLFDMGNVLLFFSHELMCRQIGEVCGRTSDDIRRLLFDSGLQIRFERGEWNEAGFHRTFQETTGLAIELAELVRAGSDIFRLNRPMLPILDALKRRGVRLVLLSNTSVSHFEWVREHFDVLDCFDDFVLSFTAGAVKPEPAIFRAVLETIDCEPGECFYTDDIAAYVETGRQFGLQAETFTGAPDLIRHLADRGIDVY